MIYQFFKNKTIFITGGTGSIGSAILHHALPLKPKKIIVFSRDEYKQYLLKFRYASTETTQIEYILGDVRDRDSLMYASRGTDILFHCSAYKHVPQSEEMPEEFVKTNVLGSMNVKSAALENGIPITISISSDKAVNPSNAMGFTKALQEKIFSSHYLQRQNSKIKFVNVRFGNVIGTKGSLFPIFYHQIKNNQPITLTDPSMTRFFMTIDEAVDLIFWSMMYGRDGETVIKKMKSVKVGKLLQVFLELTKKTKNYPIKNIGLRVGEKMHEALITEDEFFKVKPTGKFYVISPYTEKEIEKNIILNSMRKKKQSMQEFHSSYEKNFLKDAEVKKYVKEYITAVKQNKQIL